MRRMSNFNSFSQPNPWSLSVKNKPNNKKSKNKKNKTTDDCDEGFQTFRTARQALIYNQMLAGNFAGKDNESTVSSTTKDNSTANNFNSNNTLTTATSNLPCFKPFNPPYATNPTTKRLGTTGPLIPKNNNFSSTTTNKPTNVNSNCNSANTNNVNNYNAADQFQSIINEGQSSNDILEILADKRAKNLDKNIVEKILNEILYKRSELSWDQIGGLKKIKDELEEIVILPMQRPDLFIDLLSPCKGLLLFGPPGKLFKII